MSKIIMKRSELEKLIESLLIDGLISEGFDIGFGDGDDEEDTDSDKDDSDDSGDDTDADTSLVPADDKSSGESSVKRVASAIADKVSKAYTGTKELAGQLYDKLPDAKDVKDKFVGYKDTARKLSKDYGTGLLGAAIDIGDSVYDLADTTYGVSKAGVQKLAAVGQD